MGDSLHYYLANFCILLLLFFCNVHGARELADHRHAVEQVKSLLPASCSSTSKGIPISHRYGPCSPLGQKNQRLTSRQILLQDQSRVDSLNSISSNQLSSDDDGLGTELSLSKNHIAKGNFVVTLGFGTPKRDLTLIFDTGSFITWIQCQPCPNCYNQQEPIFDPSKSSTFSNASCTTPTCHYSQVYHDGSYSEGLYVRDTLTVSSDELPNFVFGCGQNNSNDFGQVAGLLGIGQGDTSLMSQTRDNFGQIFCYCLPSSESSTGYLVFGIKALVTCAPETYISLLPDQTGSNRYFVNLVGITLGQKRFDMSANGVSSSSSSTIMDSGTIISRLPPSVYSELRSAFRELMSNYSFAASTTEPMDTCYNLEGYDLKSIIPSMILHFENSQDLELDYSAVVSQETDSKDSEVCFAFAGNKDPNDMTIIGNHQQKNKKIFYSILDEQVGFSAGDDCSN